MRELFWAAFFAVVFYLVMNHLIGPHLAILQQAKIDIGHRAYEIERTLDRR